MSKDMLGAITLVEVTGLMTDLWSKLTGDNAREWLAAFKRFLRKENPWLPMDSPPVMILAASALIDCNEVPYIPSDSRIIDHKRKGQLSFVPSKVILHLDEKQKKKAVSGPDLRKRLEKHLGEWWLMNACVLDYLLLHQDLVPESWKLDELGRSLEIYFWGTVYSNKFDTDFVRGMVWNSGCWCEITREFRGDTHNGFDSRHPAAVLDL